MKKLQGLAGFTLAIIAVSEWGLNASVVINELMYHPASENLRESYVELYNSGTTAVDLSGWKFVKGLNFEFGPNTAIAARAYLVVAADRATFMAHYPSVTNFVAGWTTPMGSHVILQDAAGQTASEVNFSNDGDWAARLLTSDGPNSFGHAGWVWYAPHDGQGSSLELINPNLPNSYALNWGASKVANGTPGRANSILQTNAPPIITSVAHSPIVPRRVDSVSISSRIIDEHTNGLAATLFYRDASSAAPPGFTALPMFDDGTHNDGLPGDGIFAATVPPQPNGTVIEFYVQATDSEGSVRVYPRVIPPTNSLRTANLLYQVDEGAYSGSQPLYPLVLTEMERAELYEIGRGCPGMDSDAQMNATWVTTDGVLTGGTTTQLRYNAGVRNRGHGTRSSNPNNYHVNIAGDRPWKNSTGINLNSQYSASQILGSAIFRQAGVPMAESRAVQLRVNSTNLMFFPYADGRPVATNSFGSYAANEQYNNNFVQRAFALDPYGNSYRGIRDQTLCDSTRNSVADLSWHGANFAVASYTNAYFKQNNLLQNDWADLIDLLAVLNNQNGYQAANYTSNILRRINVDEWMKYMALNTLLDNTETCLANGVGDDYALYRGTNDTRFLALPYDMDSLMGHGAIVQSPRHNIFSMTNVPVMDPFMKDPQFAPVYYSWLEKLGHTLFAPSRMNLLLDQVLADYVPPQTLDNFKGFNASQVSWVLSQIPVTLTVSNDLPIQNAYPRSTNAVVPLYGAADAVNTRAVLVNGSLATWVAWQGTWNATSVSLSPGLNRIHVQSLDQQGVAFADAYADIWYDTGILQPAGGTITGNVIWTAAEGPYSLSSSLTIAHGASLTIQPGTTVYLNSGVNFIIADGGRLLAEGTASAPIYFGVAPGSGASWGGVTINGSVGSPETRISFAHFEGNANTCIEVAGGTLYLDHVTFGTTTHQYLSLDNSSFLVSSCVFPSTTAPFELVHGTGGIKTGGRGIVRDCFFGTTTGYNDIMDFTGGNRDLNQPIIQYYNNVFIGGSDDGLDLDGTDAWIEHNIFLHVHRNGAPDSSSGISGGDYNFGGTEGDRTSEITIIGNLFFDCDQAATAKQGNFFTMLNNTIVHMTKTGGLDTADGVINVQDRDPGPPTTFGAGYYLEGNVIRDVNQLVRNYDPAQTEVTFNNNILPIPWTGPGNGNRLVNPLLKHIPAVAETYFTNWSGAQVMWDWFGLLPGSPAHGTGPNGSDQGGVVAMGVSITGEPPPTNNQTTATLTIGTVRTGYGIPASGWPKGSGYTHYKWRLDAGSWSAETPTTSPVVLSGLSNGPHQVQVVGKRDSGWYQDAAEFGPDALVTTSRTWVVDTAYVPPAKPTVRLNEILALNTTTLTNSGATPDLLELYNYGSAPVDLSGMGLSDNATAPYKYTFPTGTPLLGAGQFLVLYADKTAGSGIHVGFSLKANGDDVYLHDKPGRGGLLLDSVVFGIQVHDLSIGRAADGTWQLCIPTFGAANQVLAVDDVHKLRINEWLADELFLANNDFIELYNPGAAPIGLGGCFLSNAEGAPALNRIADLSFIAPQDYVAFVADADASQGNEHLNFKLDPNIGILIVSDAALQPIDIITYGPQATDVAQGRSPSGSDTLVSFLQPTAGGPNPVPNVGATSVTNVTANVVHLLDILTPWKYDNSGGTNFGTGWLQPSYDDTTWSSGTGLFGHETTPAEYPFGFSTYIPAPKDAGGKITVYYRTHFQWDGSLAQVSLVSTNYIDDGAVYYLNGMRIGSLRMPATVTYNTLAGDQASEGAPEILFFTNAPVVGDNVLAVEVHQVNTSSSDDVFGMQLNAVQYVTNIIASTSTAVPVVLNEVLASNRSLTNADGTTADWLELYNPTTNTIDLGDLSLSNDPNQPRKYVLAQGSFIAPEGFFLLYCNDKLPPATNNTGFSLLAGGDQLFLFDRLINGGGLIDALSFGLQIPDFSLGRVPNGSGAWSLTVPTPAALNNAAALGSVDHLSINEWMADPVSGSDWFELYNNGDQPVALAGLFLTSDLTKKTLSPVRPFSFIGTGPHGFIQFQADGNANAGADHVKFKLSKSGDSVALFSPAGTLITAVSFGPQSTGVSQGRLPDGAATITDFPLATPGESNYLPLPNVVINEVLTHTDAPLEDAIELYNSGQDPVSIGGWFLSNSSEDFRKFRIPTGTEIDGRNFLVLYENAFNAANTSSVPFTFNSAHGDLAILSAADANGNLTGYRAVASFGAAANGVSFGRYTNSVGEVDFIAQSSRTFGVDAPVSLEQFRTGRGASNAPPLIGPMVFNEIMFYPPLIGGVEDDTVNEYVELLNITDKPVNLFDPNSPTNCWKIKGGIDYTFPGQVVIPAGGMVLLVNFDPMDDQAALAEFRSRYNVHPTALMFGPFAGHLANPGENLSLYKPDPPQLPPHPDAGFVPYVLVEQINYSATTPWPNGASGTGAALQRFYASSYGNDPGNWFVAVPTPGWPNTANPGDSNGDGLPDAWQVHYFGSIDSPQAAPSSDPDADGFTNLQEYFAGTDPTNPQSCLRLEVVQINPSQVVIQFTAVAGKTYTIQFGSGLGNSWLKLTDIPPQSTDQTIAISDPTANSNSTRFYRLVTPAQP